ncbi:MAG: hypothetical protein HUU10_04510 [Bacteroidetes bacterium]|nr:hypothetical protein [Bacteroidota bacterium]
MADKPQVNIKDAKEYNQAKSGTAKKVLLIDASTFGAGAPVVILGRMINFSWNEQYAVEPIPELNREQINEVVKGAMGLGQASFQTWETFGSNNDLPSAKNRPEMIAFVVEGDNEKFAGAVTHCFIGVHITNQGAQYSGQGGTVYRNGSVVYRERLTAAEYKAKYGAASPDAPFTIAS